MSRKLQEKLEALRLAELVGGSLDVAAEIEELLEWVNRGKRYRDGGVAPSVGSEYAPCQVPDSIV